MRLVGLAVALGLAFSGFALSGSAGAQSLPEGTVTLVVPFAAGGPVDSVARLLAEKLSPRLKRSVVVENKGGAGGDLAAAFVSRAAPDGLTWFFTVDSVLTINPYMNATQSYEASALAPVAKVGEVVLLLGVNAAKVPAKSWPELVALSKTRDISFGSAGLGSPGHMAFEYLRSVSELKGLHVPYRGAALVIQDMLSGNIDAAFVVSGVLSPHVATGALRAIAVSGAKRLASMPDVPTAREAGIGEFEARFANILMAPAKVDPAIRAIMEKAVLEATAEPDFAGKLAVVSTEAEYGGAREAAEWIARERERWGKVVKASAGK